MYKFFLQLFFLYIWSLLINTLIHTMKKVQLIYKGRVITSKGATRYSYQNIFTGKVDIYGSKLLPLSIGGIVEAEETATGVKQPYTYVGKHDNETEVSTWTTQDWATGKQIQLNREMKKLPKTEYDELVDRFNALLYNLPRSQRSLLKYRLLIDLDS